VSQRSRRGVLITGASRGIGAAIASAFASAGDRVAVHYGTRRAEADAVRKSLTGVDHIVAGADLGDARAVAAMVEQVAATFGAIDVLVNNAGLFVEHPIMQAGYEEWQDAWQQTLAVNLVGAANVTWCAVRHMPDGGRIVNISSRGAFRGEPTHPAYGASKAGLIAFGQSLARDLGARGISVTAVAPGLVDTEMAAPALSGTDGERRRAESPFGRIATAEEVAGAVLYLASPGAAFASGSVIDVNGASHLRL